VVGKKGLAEGVVELKTRATGERTTLPIAEAATLIAEMIRAERSRFAH
jgi:hypothetical protein